MLYPALAASVMTAALLSAQTAHCADAANAQSDSKSQAGTAESFGEVEASGLHWLHLSSRHGDLPVPTTSRQQTGAVVADLDKDDVNDFVLTFREKEPAVVWYRRTKTGWDRYVIDKDYLAIEAGGAVCDIDGDHYRDLIFGGDYQSNQVWWWRNPGKDWNPDVPWERHTIKKTGVAQHHDQAIADFKGTGRAQLAYWNQKAKTIFVADVPANPREVDEWPAEPIFTGSAGETGKYAEGMSAFDVDGDGQPELLAGNSMFKYLPTGKWSVTKIGEVGGLIFAGRLIKNAQYAQIVIAPGDGSGPVMWYECKGNPRESASWVGHDLVGRTLIHPHSLQLADIDGDGNLDIFVAEMAKWSERKQEPDNPKAQAFIFYGDGKGNFRKTIFQTGMGFHEARVADLDGDGRVDILSKPYNWETPRVDVWLNCGTGRRAAPSTSAPASAAAPTTHTVTVDDASKLVTYSGKWGAKADEPRDCLGTEHYSHESGASVQLTFTGTSIQWLGKRGNHYGEADVYIDGVHEASVDTYADVTPPRLFQQINYTKTGLSNASHTIKIVVTARKNAASTNNYQVVDGFIYTTDGPATPAPAQTADTASVFRRIVIDPATEQNSHKPKVFARFSSDGGNDLGGLTIDGFKLYRYAEDWKPYVVFRLGNLSQRFEDAAVADINGDGWNDIVMGGWGNQTLWAENPSGHGGNPYTTQWTIHMIDRSRFSHEVCAADISRDGKCDIITTSGIYLQGETPANWTFVGLERNGQGTFVANMLGNDDGYNDVIALSTYCGNNKIAWFENPGHTGGDPATAPWTPRIIDANPGGDVCNFEMTCMAFTAGDVNGDGRVDLVAASQGEGPGNQADNRQVGDGLVWYEGPADARAGVWVKHVIDPELAWVHASSIQLADFDGDGALDINYAQQDQSKSRQDGSSTIQQFGIFYNSNGDGRVWSRHLLSQYPEPGAGGFNSRVGIVGQDALPSIFTSLHGNWGESNPFILWRNTGAKPAKAPAPKAKSGNSATNR